MLVNVKLKNYDNQHNADYRKQYANEPDVIAHLDYRIAYNNTLPELTGIYMNAGFNFEHEMEHRLGYDGIYPVLGEIIELGSFKIAGKSPYGVADSIDQILEHYKEDLNNPDRNFCIGIEPVYREDEPSSGGWRFHKWGPYIGTFDIQHEYLYDEVNIEKVLVYHIYEIPDDLILNKSLLNFEETKQLTIQNPCV